MIQIKRNMWKSLVGQDIVSIKTNKEVNVKENYIYTVKKVIRNNIVMTLPPTGVNGIGGCDGRGFMFNSIMGNSYFAKICQDCKSVDCLTMAGNQNRKKENERN